MSTALILFAHGSRDERWAEPLRRVVEMIRASNNAPDHVEAAFLEFMSPSLQKGVANAIAAGAITIRVAPIFLGVGGHLRRDVTVLVEAARSAHPNVRIEVLAPLGESPDVLLAIAAWALA